MMEIIIQPQTVILADYTTFKIGGPCGHFFEVSDIEQLKYAIFYAGKNNLPYLIIGGGSNVLFSDNGFNGVVIKLNMKECAAQDCILKAQSGAAMKDVVAFTIEEGFSGLEWASGLPGTVGGAVRGNAGAFGKCISDSIIAVTYLDEKDKIRTIDKKKCEFKYRDNIFKHNRKYVILEAEFELNKDQTIEELKAKADKYIQYRNTNHPLEYPNAGSIFKNIDEAKEINHCLKINPNLRQFLKKWQGKISSAYLIEDCNLKNVRIGGARISEKHANFIINEANATAEDIKKLIRTAIEKVKEKYGITLKPEIMII